MRQLSLHRSRLLMSMDKLISSGMLNGIQWLTSSFQCQVQIYWISLSSGQRCGNKANKDQIQQRAARLLCNAMVSYNNGKDIVRYACNLHSTVSVYIDVWSLILLIYVVVTNNHCNSICQLKTYLIDILGIYGK